MNRLTFAIACLAAHRNKLTANEERVLNKVILGESLETGETINGIRLNWEFTEEAHFCSLQNQYLGELSRTLV